MLRGGAAVLAAAAVLASAAAAPQPLRLHVLGDLLQARRDLRSGNRADLIDSYELVLAMAERSARAAKTWSVMAKNITIPGVSPHNYISIGIYNHPCNALPEGCKAYPGGHMLPPSECNTSSGLPWEPCDGIRNPQAIASGDSPAQSDMVNAVVTAALAAFYSSNDTALAKKHVEYGATVLRVWFVANATRMLPNLYYGQITPKAELPHASHGGFIEWAHTAMFLDHISLLRYVNSELSLGVWSADDDAALTAWWREFQGYVESATAQGERRMTNNHGSWYDTDWLSIAQLNGDTAAAVKAAQEVRLKRVAYQLLPNGSEWIELERNVPSGYCQYNLKALTESADLAAGLGAANDVWGFETADGRSLRKSIDWLMAYATGSTPWPYKQPEAPDWQTMVVVLRRASRQFKNQTYERAACMVAKNGGKAKYYGRSELTLQLPPAYVLGAGCE